MTPTTILLIAAAMTFVAALALAALAVRHRDEEIGMVLGLAAFLLACGCFGAVSEAIKEARAQQAVVTQEKA